MNLYAYFLMNFGKMPNLSCMCIIKFWYQLSCFWYFWDNNTYMYFIVLDVHKTWNVNSDANLIKISTDYFWNYNLTFFDLVCRIFMYLLKIWTRCLISDPELNFDMNWPTFDIFDIAWPTFFCLLCTDLKFGPGV
jgi:hypothetical protein